MISFSVQIITVGLRALLLTPFQYVHFQCSDEGIGVEVHVRILKLQQTIWNLSLPSRNLVFTDSQLPLPKLSESLFCPLSWYQHRQQLYPRPWGLHLTHRNQRLAVHRTAGDTAAKDKDEAGDGCLFWPLWERGLRGTLDTGGISGWE